MNVSTQMNFDIPHENRKSFQKKFSPVVIVPEMILGSLLMSAKQAIGIPQFATGPQKCVLIKDFSCQSLNFSGGLFTFSPHQIFPELRASQVFEQFLSCAGHFDRFD